MTRKSWAKMTTAEREAAVVNACRAAPMTRTDLVNDLDVTDMDALNALLAALKGRGDLAEGFDSDGFATFLALKEPGAVVGHSGEETRPIPDRRLLCRITPERRAEINAHDAEMSREEARLERQIMLAKEKLKAVHEQRMQHAEASESETEMRDVPCVEVLRFESGLAYTRRCDDPAAWPEGTPEDGVVGDPRTLIEADYQPVLPFTADGGLDGEALANIVGAVGAEKAVEPVAAVVKGKRGGKRGGGK